MDGKTKKLIEDFVNAASQTMALWEESGLGDDPETSERAYNAMNSAIRRGQDALAEADSKDDMPELKDTKRKTPTNFQWRTA